MSMYITNLTTNINPTRRSKIMQVRLRAHAHDNKTTLPAAETSAGSIAASNS
jgi:hypothetical protein